MIKLNGGKAIASGGFGCIFKPAIKCKTRKNNTNAGITKLMKIKYAVYYTAFKSVIYYKIQIIR